MVATAMAVKDNGSTGSAKGAKALPSNGVISSGGICIVTCCRHSSSAIFQNISFAHINFYLIKNFIFVH
jgi:hypothetical protein